MENIKFSLNQHDWFSSFRNWMVLNTAILVVYWNQITKMLVDWNFDWIEIRKIAVLSISSFFLFMIKRYIMGEKPKKRILEVKVPVIELIVEPKVETSGPKKEEHIPSFL